MRTLACADCGNVPKKESTWHYGRDGRQVEWTRQPGGRCWTCHQEHTERLEREVEEQLEAARTANAALPGRPRRSGPGPGPVRGWRPRSGGCSPSWNHPPASNTGPGPPVIEIS
ncbi:hypothetical protein [Streptomyces sp. CBMA123]|uniref:hypothetical protein n=1 Tax=Streptomyces sp. CBMA123 TaxID=1896313 RepID=UPI001661FEC1|nr:hypothetical protein [Streptomyces sp. CBMA123]MBD0694742.1 hypothetical protein [Streptomyces sp. CBMA123]